MATEQTHPNRLNRIELDEQTMPPLTLHEWSTASSQIAMHLRKILAQYQREKGISSVQLPSVIALAGLFRCCEADIFDALVQLRQLSYHYLMHGINTPIILNDPFQRTTTPAKRWQTPATPRREVWESMVPRRSNTFSPIPG